MRLARGAIVVVDLDPAVGHEQKGVRPSVVVSDPAVSDSQRFPLVGVIPITGTPRAGSLYPRLSPGASGLVKFSYALVDHVRSIDKRRIRRVFGRLPADEIEAIDDGLRAYFGLTAR